MSALAITGLGLVCTLGHDVATACAALRCGLTRPAPVDFEVPADEELGNTPLTGHPLLGISEGFQGLGLYLRLATHALEDLLHDAGLRADDAAMWRHATLHVGLSPTRNEEIDFYDDILRERMAEEVLMHMGMTLPPQRAVSRLQGHASALVALHEATKALERGEAERALVVGVDSLLESDVLEVLYGAGRLKCAGQARGLMPGEAAAAFLVETRAQARRRGARPRCWLERVEVRQAPSVLQTGARPNGAGLSEVVSRALGKTRPGALYGDLNGEEWRSLEWGNALVRLREAGHDLSEVAQYWPATSLGRHRRRQRRHLHRRGGECAGARPCTARRGARVVSLRQGRSGGGTPAGCRQRGALTRATEDMRHEQSNKQPRQVR
jgi:3-oxoacyl-[acyl-carrier-protein] synthase-1